MEVETKRAFILRPFDIISACCYSFATYGDGELPVWVSPLASACKNASSGGASSCHYTLILGPDCRSMRRGYRSKLSITPDFLVCWVSKREASRPCRRFAQNGPGCRATPCGLRLGTFVCAHSGKSSNGAGRPEAVDGGDVWW
jgi:hypothetical protein